VCYQGFNRKREDTNEMKIDGWKEKRSENRKFSSPSPMGNMTDRTARKQASKRSFSQTCKEHCEDKREQKKMKQTDTEETFVPFQQEQHARPC